MHLFKCISVSYLPPFATVIFATLLISILSYKCWYTPKILVRYLLVAMIPLRELALGHTAL